MWFEPNEKPVEIYCIDSKFDVVPLARTRPQGDSPDIPLLNKSIWFNVLTGNWEIIREFKKEV